VYAKKMVEPCSPAGGGRMVPARLRPAFIVVMMGYSGMSRMEKSWPTAPGIPGNWPLVTG
jgi:hypothetical protein